MSKLLDKILYKLKILPNEQWTGIQTFFIVSTGRTGTKFLANFYNNFDRVFTVHEPYPDFRSISPKYIVNEIPHSVAVKKFDYGRRLIAKKVKQNNCNKYIESNSRLSYLIPVIRDVIDDPKFIHIVRDGRNYLRSAMSRPYGPLFSKNDKNLKITAKDFPEDPFYREWDNMDVFEKISWYWVKKDSLIIKELKENDSITIKYEDIFKKNFEGIIRLSKFIGVNIDKTIELMKKKKSYRINKSDEYKIPHWTRWSEDKISTFNKIAYNHMKKYDYY
jgi:hypothetical protein